MAARPQNNRGDCDALQSVITHFEAVLNITKVTAPARLSAECSEALGSLEDALRIARELIGEAASTGPLVSLFRAATLRGIFLSIDWDLSNSLNQLKAEGHLLTGINGRAFQDEMAAAHDALIFCSIFFLQQQEVYAKLKEIVATGSAAAQVTSSPPGVLYRVLLKQLEPLEELQALTPEQLQQELQALQQAAARNDEYSAAHAERLPGVGRVLTVSTDLHLAKQLKAALDSRPPHSTKQGLPAGGMSPRSNYSECASPTGSSSSEVETQPAAKGWPGPGGVRSPLGAVMGGSPQPLHKCIDLGPSSSKAGLDEDAAVCISNNQRPSSKAKGVVEGLLNKAERVADEGIPCGPCRLTCVCCLLLLFVVLVAVAGAAGIAIWQLGLQDIQRERQQSAEKGPAPAAPLPNATAEGGAGAGGNGTLPPLSETPGCPVSYERNGSGRPLLFGGIFDRKCEEGCKPRNTTSDHWPHKRYCSFTPGTAGTICTDEKKESLWTYLDTVADGELKQLSPCMLWPYLRSRTLWLVGDSHTVNFFRALGCFLVDFWDGQETCLPSADQAHIDEILSIADVEGGMKGQNQPECMHLQSRTRICLIRAMRGEMYTPRKDGRRDGIVPFLQDHLAETGDIFMLSFGSWHRYGFGYTVEFDAAVKHLSDHYLATKETWPHMFFRSVPSAHFADKKNKKCHEFSGFKLDKETGYLNTSGSNINSMQAGTLFNKKAQDVLWGVAGVPVISSLSSNLSIALADQHPGSRVIGWTDLDCLHQCQGGIPQVWIWEVFDAFRRGLTGIQPVPPEQVRPVEEQLPCVPVAGEAGLIRTFARGFGANNNTRG